MFLQKHFEQVESLNLAKIASSGTKIRTAYYMSVFFNKMLISGMFHVPKKLCQSYVTSSECSELMTYQVGQRESLLTKKLYYLRKAP